MGACNSAQTLANNPSAALSSVPQDFLRPSLNRKSYTVRSPANYPERTRFSCSSSNVSRSDANEFGRKRQNSITVAARADIRRTPISTLVTSQSHTDGNSLCLSEKISSITSQSEAINSISICTEPSPTCSDVISSSEITVQLVSRETETPGVALIARGSGAVQPTARERLFGTFEHRSPDFKAFYSRPDAFRYENSPFFRTVAKHFHPNMESGTLEGTIYKKREFVLQSSDVQVPEGDCENQWLGKHVVHFYNSISIFYHRISRLCTTETCPKMHAGSQVEFRWQNEKGQIRTVSAPKYVKLLFTWIDKQISDSNIFPFPESRGSQNKEHTSSPSENEERPVSSAINQIVFPDEFRTITANILRKLWRVIAHLYYGHFKRIRLIGLEDELNFRFYHLAFFALEFDLLPTTELRPLRSLIVMRLPEHLTSGIPW